MTGLALSYCLGVLEYAISKIKRITVLLYGNAYSQYDWFWFQLKQLRLTMDRRDTKGKACTAHKEGNLVEVTASLLKHQVDIFGYNHY